MVSAPTEGISSMHVQRQAPRLSTAKAAGASQPASTDLPSSQQFVQDVLMRRSDLWAASDKLLALCEKQGTKVTRDESLLGTLSITVANGNDKVTIVQGESMLGDVYYDVNDGEHQVRVKPTEDLLGNEQTEITGDRHVTLKKSESLLGVKRESAEGDVKADIEYGETLLGDPETTIKTGGHELTAHQTESAVLGIPQVELKGPDGTRTVSLNETFLGDTELEVKGGDRAPAPPPPQPKAPPAPPAPKQPEPPVEKKPEPPVPQKPEPKPPAAKPSHPWWKFWA